jgi:hypothetical protein
MRGRARAQPALSGKFYAMFICNITPAVEHYHQTRSTVQVPSSPK